MQVIKRTITELPRPEALRNADLADLSGFAGLLDEGIVLASSIAIDGAPAGVRTVRC